MSVVSFFADAWQNMGYTTLTDDHLTMKALYDTYGASMIEQGMANGFLDIDTDYHRDYVDFETLKSLYQKDPTGMVDVEINLDKLTPAILSLDCFEHEHHIKEALAYGTSMTLSNPCRYDDQYDFPVISADKQNRIPAGPIEMKQLFDQCFTIFKSIDFRRDQSITMDKRRSLTKMAVKLALFKDVRPSTINLTRMYMDVPNLLMIGGACKCYEELAILTKGLYENNTLKTEVEAPAVPITNPQSPLYHAENRYTRSGNSCEVCDTSCGSAIRCWTCSQPERQCSDSEDDSEPEFGFPNQQQAEEFYSRPCKRIRV